MLDLSLCLFVEAIRRLRHSNRGLGLCRRVAWVREAWWPVGRLESQIFSGFAFRISGFPRAEWTRGPGLEWGVQRQGSKLSQAAGLAAPQPGSRGQVVLFSPCFRVHSVNCRF